MKTVCTCIFVLTAVRSGDYYMFDEFDDTEVQMKDDDSSEDEDIPKKMGIGKVSYFVTIWVLYTGESAGL